MKEILCGQGGVGSDVAASAATGSDEAGRQRHTRFGSCPWYTPASCRQERPLPLRQRQKIQEMLHDEEAERKPAPLNRAPDALCGGGLNHQRTPMGSQQ
jgi:hypothetical protein